MALNTPTLDDLVSQLPPTLGQGIMTPEQQQLAVQNQMGATAPSALRQYGNTSQQIAESNFGRGMGLSSYNAYQQALQSLMQQEGMANVQAQAQNQVDAAQRAAVGNAMSYATSEKNRQQAASEGAANRSLAKKGINAANQRQMMGQVYSGAGGLAAGGLGLLARDLVRPQGEPSGIGQAYGRLKDMLPSMGERTPGTDAQQNEIPTSEPYSQPSLQGFQLEPGGGVTSPGGGYGFEDYTSQLNMPSFYGPSMDLSGLLQDTWDTDMNMYGGNY